MFETDFFNKKRILITGASGFVGSNLVPLFNDIDCELFLPSKKDFDLRIQSSVKKLFKEVKPNIVFHLAALVGGIKANMNYPASFFYDNLISQTLVMHEAHLSSCEKFITLMGGCSYPNSAVSPINEDQIWNGYPHEGAAAYSSAKKMNIVMSESYRTQFNFNSLVLVPGNIYGPYDNFDLENSHVIPALIRKYYEAQENDLPEVIAWGTGRPQRDFIYIQDAVEAIFKASVVLNTSKIINISSGKLISIKTLTEKIAQIVKYDGKIIWDKSKPDGQMIKGFDVKKMTDLLEFKPEYDLEEGLKLTFEWFKANIKNAKLELDIR